MDRLISASLDHVIRLCTADHYDYIVIGSGIGGGVLARSLVEYRSSCPNPYLCPTPCHSRHNARVLIIERGGLLLDTHCTNIASPRWNSHSFEGPSMDNAMVYDTLKNSFATVTSKSSDYAGGPVYGIGGRSLVWGLYTPMVAKSQLEQFPTKVREYLNDVDNYNKAYRLMTNDPEATIANPYPMNIPSPPAASGHDTWPIWEVLARLNGGAVEPYGAPDELNGTHNRPNNEHEKEHFELCPMAAEFTARMPIRRLYQMVMGGYSTATWILEQVFNKSEYLNLLSGTQVVAINCAQQGNRPLPNHVESLTVLDHKGKERTIPTRKATVILSAGTIDTAMIALRSGLGAEKNLVGHGLTDHDIWGTRFAFLPGPTVQSLNGQALRVQKLAKMKPNPGYSVDEYEEIDCLVNITINAPSFLGQVNNGFPMRYIGPKNEILSKQDFEAKVAQLHKEKSIQHESMVQVVYCFPSPLIQKNKVLNLPKLVPTIEVSKKDTSMYTQAMETTASHIIEALSKARKWPEGSEDSPVTPTPTPAPPRVSRAPFGVVAHEVGTMRMGESPERSVVNSDLQVHGWKNLFVCDLSVFPMSPSSNPSLTLAALAQRLAQHLESKRPTG